MDSKEKQIISVLKDPLESIGQECVQTFRGGRDGRHIVMTERGIPGRDSKEPVTVVY